MSLFGGIASATQAALAQEDAARAAAAVQQQYAQKAKDNFEYPNEIVLTRRADGSFGVPLELS